MNGCANKKRTCEGALCWIGLVCCCLLFLLCFGNALLTRSCAGYSALLFHCLAGFLRPLGSDFGTFLALFLLHLLAAQQLDECLLSAIALLPAFAGDAQVAAFPITEARRDGVEQFLHGLPCHQVRSRPPPRGQIAALA